MGAEKGGTYFVTSYGNNEYYTGCSAYQGNVDMRPGSARSQYGGESYQGQELVEAGVAFAGDGYTDMNDGAVVELMTKRLQYVMGKVLTQLHADAKPVEGIDVTYTINLGVYEGFNLSSCTHQLINKAVIETRAFFFCDKAAAGRNRLCDSRECSIRHPPLGINKSCVIRKSDSGIREAGRIPARHSAATPKETPTNHPTWDRRD